MSDLVPIFPLPNLVLLPRAVVPLHIFEERYKAMTADALAGDRRIAMALLAPGWERDSQSTPRIGPVVCVGNILQHEQLPDGTYNFLLQGVQRARVVREELVGLYRAAEVEPLSGPNVFEIDLLPLRARLTDLLDKALAHHKLAGKFTELLATVITTADAADVIAYHLIEDPAERRLMLEEADARLRVARLVDNLERHARLAGPPPEHLGRRLGLN